MAEDTTTTIQPIAASITSFTRALDRHPVLWVGAGLSIAAGYPSTARLVDALVGAAEAEDPMDRSQSFYQVVDAVVRSVGKGRVRDVLQGLFQPARPPAPAHRAIARLAKAGRFAAIVTTNYDDLLERALAEAGAPYVLQPLEDNATVTGEGVRLLKVHGSYDDWERVVLSGRSYAQFGKQYPFLRAQLDVLLRQQPVLFAGCSLQDPRVLDWIAALPDAAAEGLKEWRALLTDAEWRRALAYDHEGTAAGEILARAPMRPLVVRDHDHARELLVEAAGALSAAAEVVALELTVTGTGLSAAMAGAGQWTPVNVLDDARFVGELRELRELDHHPLPTDQQGRLAPAVAGIGLTIRALAERVGGALTGMLSPAAQRKLAQAVGAGLGAEPPLLHVRVRAGAAEAERLAADRLLALPWELLVVDGQLPVERGTLDVAREAVVEGAPGLAPPERVLSVVAAVSAPVDASRLDHEGECYRLWLAMGQEERRLHLTDTGTLEATFEAVEQVKPSVLHFTGHGEPGTLLFEDEEALSVKVPVRALVDGLRLRALPRLAFLASCHGASIARLDALAAVGGGGRRDAGSGRGATDGAEASAAEASGADARSEGASGAAGLGPASARVVDPALLIAEDPIWSSAAELQREGIPNVVGWFGPVGDRQSTRAEEVFYAALVQGETARRAVRRARQACRQPLRSMGKPAAVYPLGWAQLALYHRGADVPVALPASGAPAPIRERTRVSRRVDAPRGPVGVEQLRFGFVGRRATRAQVLRRVQEGQRLLVVHGLGGLGKTALCATLAPIVARKVAPRAPGGEPIALPVIALDGRFAGQAPAPIEELWHQAAAALGRWKPDDEGWAAAYGATLAEQQKDGLGGAGLARVLAWFAAAARGLVVYLDDAESLQEAVARGAGGAAGAGGPEIGRWRDAELAAFWEGLVRLAAPGGAVAVLASSRFVPRGLPGDASVPLPVMARIDVVQLLPWWPALGALPPRDAAWLAERLDGHPRSVAWLDALARERAEALAPPGGTFGGDLRREVIEPVLPSLDAKIDADLLLPQLLAALGPEVRSFVRRLGVLARPAPWGALLSVQGSEGTAARAQAAGLVSPFESPSREARWAPHRMVLAKAGDLDAAEAKEAHRTLGAWFRARWEEQQAAVALAEDAAHHLCEAGEGTAAWEPTRGVVLWLRHFGRDREALGWVRRALSAKPAGKERGLALALEVQLGLRAGDVPPDAEARLAEAEALVDAEDRAFVLNELGKFHRHRGQFPKAADTLTRAVTAALQARGTEEHRDVASSLSELAGVLLAQSDLAGARECLERSLRIKAKVFGTDEHPSVAASLHELARVLEAQGDLAGARKHLERSLRIQRKVFRTDEHPSVAASLHTLACVLEAQGDPAGAREHLGRSLCIKAKVLGTEEHADIAASLHALAVVLQAQGDLAGAREHLEQSLRIQRKVFGTEEHPSVAASLAALACALEAQGDLAGAREHLEQSLRIQRKVFGTEERSSVAASLHELARVLEAQGDLAGARECYERTLAIQKRLYGGREHFSTAITEASLGLLLAEMGEKERAVGLLLHAYQVFLARLGPDHPHTKTVARYLGR